jgi:hypothetical protein
MPTAWHWLTVASACQLSKRGAEDYIDREPGTGCHEAGPLGIHGSPPYCTVTTFVTESIPEALVTVSLTLKEAGPEPA